MVGGLLAWCLTRLRTQWLRLYIPWLRHDRALTCRIPKLGRWLYERDIGLTRDLLPFAGFFLWLGASFSRSDDPYFWFPMLMALLISLFLSYLWSKGLRWLSGG